MNKSQLWKLFREFEALERGIRDLQQRAIEFISDSDNACGYHWEANSGAPAEALQEKLVALDSIETGLSRTVDESMSDGSVDDKAVSLRFKVSSLRKLGVYKHDTCLHDDDAIVHYQSLGEIASAIETIMEELKGELANPGGFCSGKETIRCGGIEEAILLLHHLDKSLSVLVNHQLDFASREGAAESLPLRRSDLEPALRILNTLDDLVSSEKNAFVLLDSLKSIRKAFDDCWKLMRTHNYSVGAHANVAQSILTRVRHAHSVACNFVKQESELMEGIRAVQDRVKCLLDVHEPYRSDIIATIDDAVKCFEGQAYIAVMCLCGRLLEAALKMRVMQIPERDRTPIFSKVLQANSTAERKTALDKITLGALVSLVEKFPNQNVTRLPPALAKMVDIITLYRNSNAHTRSATESPFPTIGNARMAIDAILEMLNLTCDVLANRGDCREENNNHD